MTSGVRATTWGPVLFFLVIAGLGGTFGLTDDEAYYWVLAQKPALGYAFHPPAVAWLIAAFEKILGPVFGAPSPFLVRLPGVLCMSISLWLALRWLERAGASSRRLWNSLGLILSFAGVSALSWMMVPDLPLFLGWTLAFVSVWRICFSERSSLAAYLGIAAGVGLALISKYSGVLVAVSSGLAVLLWASRDRRWKAIVAIALGLLAAGTPILIWNAQHDWESILWQLRGRHGAGELSLLRYGRFWLVEALVAGPVLIAFAFAAIRWGAESLWRRDSTVLSYGLVWTAPGFIFLLQPLWTDFKPHWAFVIWWPMALVFAWAWSSGAMPRWNRWARVQMVYGLTLGALILISCQLPLGGWVIRQFAGPSADYRWDVTNDLYGWSELASFVREKLGKADLPVVGSRYQTASQAAFALNRYAGTTLIPRDLKARDEWPDLGVSDGIGPAWPKLKSAVLFVADNRYSEGPQFPGARCTSLGKVEKARFGFPAKWIELWRCEP